MKTPRLHQRRKADRDLSEAAQEFELIYLEQQRIIETLQKYLKDRESLILTLQRTIAEFTLHRGQR